MCFLNYRWPPYVLCSMVCSSFRAGMRRGMRLNAMLVVHLGRQDWCRIGPALGHLYAPRRELLESITCTNTQDVMPGNMMKEIGRTAHDRFFTLIFFWAKKQEDVRSAFPRNPAHLLFASPTKDFIYPPRRRGTCMIFLEKFKFKNSSLVFKKFIKI